MLLVLWKSKKRLHYKKEKKYFIWEISQELGRTSACIKTTWKLHTTFKETDIIYKNRKIMQFAGDHWNFGLFEQNSPYMSDILNKLKTPNPFQRAS